MGGSFLPQQTDTGKASNFAAGGRKRAPPHQKKKKKKKKEMLFLRDEVDMGQEFAAFRFPSFFRLWNT